MLSLFLSLHRQRKEVYRQTKERTIAETKSFLLSQYLSLNVLYLLFFLIKKVTKKSSRLNDNIPFTWKSFCPIAGGASSRRDSFSASLSFVLCDAQEGACFLAGNITFRLKMSRRLKRGAGKFFLFEGHKATQVRKS